MIRKELGKSDLEQPVFRAIASAWSAGANDQAIMEFLAAVSDIRISAVENVARSVDVVSEAERLWLAEYMRSLGWSTEVKAAGVVDNFGKHKDCVLNGIWTHQYPCVHGLNADDLWHIITNHRCLMTAADRHTATLLPASTCSCYPHSRRP